MKIKFALYIIVVLLTISCKSNSNNKEEDFLNESIERLGVLSNDYKWIVILPGVGCHGCIQDGEFFMKNNINRKDILFVLTKISSFKILQQKIGVKLKEYQNVMWIKKKCSTYLLKIAYIHVLLKWKKEK